jgi:hypothetical protein
MPVEINDLGTIGVIADTPAHLIPPEAFTTALNMRVVNNGMQRLGGQERTFGTPPVAPHFALPVRTAASVYWLYTSLTKAYVWDGSGHSDATRVAGDYTAAQTRDWNGTLLASIPILNNSVDVPQYWAPIAAGVRLQNLTNWPSTVRAKVIRAFGPFLIAINITKSGSNYPHMVKWSHPADPGTIPISWDETDPTKDAGEFELPDVDAGILLDAKPLSETMYLYKESSVWKLRFVGGRDIFATGQAAWLTTTGLLAPRCVCTTGDGTRHVWASQDDILWHDGNQVKSLLTDRRRRELFDSIDNVNYVNSFMFTNPLFGEVWFCYPTSGNVQPNAAFIFNYLEGGNQWPITSADGINFRNAAIGPIQSPDEVLWSTDSGTWEGDDGPWSQNSRRRLVTCGTDATAFYNMDKGSTRDGAAFTGTLQRLSLGLLGKKRNGDWIVDFDRYKTADRLWMKSRGQMNVRLGTQALVEGGVTWTPSIAHDPSQRTYLDMGPVTGRALAIEFSSANDFRVDGYSIDVQDAGGF